MKEINIILLSLLMSLLETYSIHSETIQWIKQFQPDSSGAQVSYATKSDNNYFYITGKTNSPYGLFQNSYVTCLDSTAKEIWTKIIFAQNFSISYFSYYLNVEQDARITLLGNWMKHPEDNSGYFFKYELSRSGDSISMVKNDSLKSIYGTPFFYQADDSSILYSNKRLINKTYEGVFFVKTDKSGNPLWKKKLKDDSLYIQTITRPVKDGDSGFVFVCLYMAEDTTLIALKTDTECNERWRKKLELSEPVYFASIYPSSDGSYYISSRYIGYGTPGCSFELVKLDSQLNIVWQRRYHHDILSNINSIVLTDYGNIICGGYSDDNAWLLVVKSDSGDVISDTTFVVSGKSNQIKYILPVNSYSCMALGNTDKNIFTALISNRPSDVQEKKNSDNSTLMSLAVKDYLMCDVKYQGHAYTIYSVEGNLILQGIIEEKTDLSMLINGIYLLKIGDKYFKLLKY